MIFLPQNFWEIRHTALKGHGVFAKKTIRKGTVIGDYLGIAVSNLEFDFEHDPAKDYVMYYSDLVSIVPQNISSSGVHCINHSCKPNCWLYPYKGHTLFFAIRDINPHEELTIHYLLASKGISCEENCTHICQCESKNCSGTMHLSEEQFLIWQKYYELENNKTTIEPVQPNKPLNKLAVYPKKIKIPEILLKRITVREVA